LIQNKPDIKGNKIKVLSSYLSFDDYDFVFTHQKIRNIYGKNMQVESICKDTCFTDKFVRKYFNKIKALLDFEED
jgi:hypothetical protein